MRALIVGEGHERGPLAAARSLAAAGWQVGIGTPGSRGLLARSRAVSYRHHVPAAGEGAEGFIEAVERAIRNRAYDIVFCAGDGELLLLSEQRDRFAIRFPYADHSSLVGILDKVALSSYAREAGFDAPETREAADVVPEALTYPVVLKEKVHAARADNGPARVEATVVHDPEELRRLMNETGADAIQRFVPGPLMAYTCVLDRDGVLVGASQQVTEKIWPQPAGVSARAVTIPVDPAMTEAVVGLLRGAGCWGLFEVQFIEGPSGPSLIDINPRFYGSLALAVASGVDLPVLWAEVAIGRTVDPVIGGRTGVRYQWLEGDLRRAWSAPDGGRFRSVLETLRASRGAAHSVMSSRDPAPAIRHSVTLASRALRRAARWK